eukprot:71020_1
MAAEYSCADGHIFYDGTEQPKQSICAESKVWSEIEKCSPTRGAKLTVDTTTGVARSFKCALESHPSNVKQVRFSIHSVTFEDLPLLEHERDSANFAESF